MHKRNWKAVRTVAITLLLLLGLAPFLMISYIRTLANRATEPVQNPAQYKEILAEYDGGPEVVAHFPLRIPETATDVEFYHKRRILQGGSCLRLRHKLPLSELEAIVHEFRPMAQHIENGKSFDIPDDFLAVYLENSESPEWNGYVYGVAVSLERQEVIYWAEDVRT